MSQLRIGPLNEPTALAAGLPDASAFGSFSGSILKSPIDKALELLVTMGGATRREASSSMAEGSGAIFSVKTLADNGQKS